MAVDLSEMDRERLLALAHAFTFNYENAAASLADRRGWWLHVDDDRSEADPLLIVADPARPLQVRENLSKPGAVGGVWAFGPLPTTCDEMDSLAALLRKIAQTREPEPTAGGDHGP